MMIPIGEMKLLISSIERSLKTSSRKKEDFYKLVASWGVFCISKVEWEMWSESVTAG